MSGARHAASGPLLRAPLFLVGSERSGTTLLRLMLDHHPEIAFEKEFDFAVELISESGDLPPLAAYRDWLGTVRGVDYTIDRTLAYRALVDDFLRQKQAASGGKPYIGATVHRRFDRIRHIWPDARYIHLVRDPRDVARSVVQKGWAGNVYQAAEFWTTAERCWDALAPHLADGQAIEIRYEDLVLRTERVLEAVCAFAGVGYSAQMLDYTADAPQYPPPDPALVLQWRTRLPPADVALVELRTGDLLTRRGYAPSGNPLPGDRAGAARTAPDRRAVAAAAHAPGDVRSVARDDGRSRPPARPAAAGAARAARHQRRRAEPDRPGGGRKARAVGEHRPGRRPAAARARLTGAGLSGGGGCAEARGRGPRSSPGGRAATPAAATLAGSPPAVGQAGRCARAGHRRRRLRA